MEPHPYKRANGRLPHRRSIRLKGYDYSQPGAYFITICTQNRHHLFGKIVVGEMKLNDAGKMVESIWNDIAEYYHGIEIDAFQIMPNHIHGIVIITVGAGPRACPELGQPQGVDELGQPQGVDELGQPQGVAPTAAGLSLPDVVHRFKTMTTKRYIDGVKQKRWIRFDGKLWQRNYWEHIIRNDNEYNRITQYIRDNPSKWDNDQLNSKSGNIVMEMQSDYGIEPWMI